MDDEEDVLNRVGGVALGHAEASQRAPDEPEMLRIDLSEGHSVLPLFAMLTPSVEGLLPRHQKIDTRALRPTSNPTGDGSSAGSSVTAAPTSAPARRSIVTRVRTTGARSVARAAHPSARVPKRGPSARAE